MIKRNIVVIEAVSSGVNYIHDINEMGYNPVCVELYHEDEDEREQMRFLHDFNYSLVCDNSPDIIMADESYEKTFEMIKELDPILIIPGSDLGIPWANKMSYELGLPANNPELLDKMMDKRCMQESIRNSNLRYIRSKVITSFEEAKEFISETDSSKVVVKPAIGRASVGVCICMNDDDLRDAIALNEDISSQDDEMIIQEYVGGDEYVLDSVSCNGVNRIVAGYKYEKIQTDGGAPIYDYLITVDENDSSFKEIMEYHKKVILAIGVEYGAIHAEYKIDEKGPALMEVNCRVNGGVQLYFVEDKAWGYHHAGVSLEAYLNPDEFMKKCDDPVYMNEVYVRKDLIVPEECYVTKSNVETVFKDLESFECAIAFGEDRVYPKTVDLSTCGGIIHLVNKDRTKLMDDLAAVKKTEHEEFDKILEIKK
ncbi:MAG: ATP-grasp domain-containing protein [Methanobrevibacter millerae]|uniref:ATP-grasp domain-containing protein n=1 Tax=Methanobrevibacter millerae TaxID=230361 RepID=A0A8T3VJI7_9EURY|nr:ATP-grasp domain-containing protein [Methanobrevibacter millerae]MBE6506256.1 ATP-grasp domain-containing protein [Methanobrevibacter millerae]